MKAVLDEGVPVRLVHAIGESERHVEPFPNDWKGLQNGELLERMRQSGFDCLVTADKNLAYQQNIARSGLAVIVLPLQRFEDLIPYVSEIAEAIEKARPGDVAVIALRGRT